LKYHPGETLLETARRRLRACLVAVIAGRVRKRSDIVLSEDDMASGIVLACQSTPVSNESETNLS
jgi:hypothetical protein